MKAPRGWARKSDPNQTQIVKELRQLNLPVKVVSHCPKGVLDIIVGYRGMLNWIEIKSGPDAPITPQEQKTLDLFRGYPVFISCTTEEILQKIGATNVRTNHDSRNATPGRKI